jgi:MFS family permease
MPEAGPRTTLRPRASSIAVAFVANGMGGPSFLPRLPERQAALDLSDAGLGLVLVGMAAGAMVASPLAGRAVGRVGSRRVVVGATLALTASLWTAGAAPSPALLFVALAVIGAADAAMDIAMNANGAAYERRSGRSLMHRLHGAWSLGALGGAGAAAVTAALGVSPTVQLAAVGVTMAVGVLATRDGLVEDRARRPVATSAPGAPGSDLTAADAPAPGTPAAGPQTPPTASPPPKTTATGPAADLDSPSPTAGVPADHTGQGRRRRAGRATGGTALVVLGTATVGGALVEGAPADWSALRLDRLGAGPGAAALGFAGFMAGMLAGRLVGDRLTDRLGGVTVLRGGMALAAVGLLVGALVDHPAVFALGLVLAGMGVSGFFPLAFSAAGNTPGVAPGAGAATVSLMARVGFLVEPLVMGALAETLGLRWAFVVVAVVTAALAAAAPLIVPSGARPVEGTVPDVRSV